MSKLFYILFSLNFIFQLKIIKVKVSNEQKMDKFKNIIVEYYNKNSKKQIKEIYDNKIESLWISDFLFILPNNKINIIIAIVFLILPLFYFIFKLKYFFFEYFLIILGNFFTTFIILTYTFTFLKLNNFWIFFICQIIYIIILDFIMLFSKEITYIICLVIDFVFINVFLKFTLKMNILFCLCTYATLEWFLFLFYIYKRFNFFNIFKYYVLSLYLILSIFYFINYFFINKKYFILLQILLLENENQRIIYCIPISLHIYLICLQLYNNKEIFKKKSNKKKKLKIKS